MICLQGHSTGMHISLGISKYPGDDALIGQDEQYLAKYALDNGYCPVMMEQRFMGQCGGSAKGPGCHTDWSAEYKMSVLSCLSMGRTAIGERVWDVSRLIDVLEKEFSFLDMDNVCLTGHSGGGTASFYATCIDERIEAVMPSCKPLIFARIEDNKINAFTKANSHTKTRHAVHAVFFNQPIFLQA